MSAVEAIFTAFGSVNRIADATGLPQQTVSSWRIREPAEIPPWHRATVADAAGKAGVELPTEALAYLASRRRTPKAKPVRPTPESATARAEAA